MSLDCLIISNKSCGCSLDVSDHIRFFFFFFFFFKKVRRNQTLSGETQTPRVYCYSND